MLPMEGQNEQVVVVDKSIFHTKKRISFEVCKKKKKSFLQFVSFKGFVVYIISV